jgi:predicted ATPase
LHGQIARTLEDKFSAIVASQPEIAAHHCTEAGLVEPAIDYWLKAGQHAARRSANVEALNHFARGFDLLPKIDDPMLRPHRSDRLTYEAAHIAGHDGTLESKLVHERLV